MIDFSPCKINIGLEIVSKRNDGYHNLETILYPIPLYDIIELKKSEEKGFKYFQSGLIVDSVIEDNLLYKTWQLVNKQFKISGVRAHLHKQVPMGAGLGGGSANAATLLKMLNVIFKLNLSIKQLNEMVATLGADCPFFIENKPVFAYDIGTKFKPINLDLKKYFIVIIKPQIHINTKEAYSGVEISNSSFNLLKINDLPIEKWQDVIVNRFEKHIFEKHPLLREISNELKQLGAFYTSMSGSGSAIYGLFEKPINYSSKSESYFVWQGNMI